MIRKYFTDLLGGIEMRRERAFFSLLLGLGLVLLIGLVRPPEYRGLNPDDFWYAKMNWRGCADLLLAGDSRVYMAACPAVMKQHLPERRILNYGFDLAGFSKNYLAAIEKVLDPRSPCKTIVLGISPHSLTRRAIEQSLFADWQEEMERLSPWLMRSKLVTSRVFHRFTDPFSPEKFLGLVGLYRAPRFLCEYFPDGSGGSTLKPPKPQISVEGAPRRFNENAVSARIEQDVIEAVRRWSRAGIQVYAYRSPTTADNVAIEDKLGQFDEGAFRAKLEAAGGKWIPVVQDAYESYDGSHLDWIAAQRFSRDLAATLAAQKVREDRKATQ